MKIHKGRFICEFDEESEIDKAYRVYTKTKSKTAKEKYLKLAKQYNEKYNDVLYKINVR